MKRPVSHVQLPQVRCAPLQQRLEIYLAGLKRGSELGQGDLDRELVIRTLEMFLSEGPR